jgi:sec-independent protein translocase protein TatC
VALNRPRAAWLRVGEEDALPIVDHLGELRMRLMVCAAAFAVAFGLAFWQNHTLLGLLNHPLERATAARLAHTPGGPLAETANEQPRLRVALNRQRAAFELLARSPSQLGGAQRQALIAAAAADAAVVAISPTAAEGRLPVTLGIGEPFAQTTTVSAYFALLLALPVILWQLYAFVIPALTRRERRAAAPLVATTLLLLALGIVFGYFVVLPGAVGFLQNFNASSFDALVQASSYYSFVSLTLLVSGMLFQIPIVVIALTQAGVVSTRQLRKHRRYAIVIITALALLLPGSDPVTTALELAPMLVLYELSIAVAARLERRIGRRYDHPVEQAH